MLLRLSLVQESNFLFVPDSALQNAKIIFQLDVKGELIFCDFNLVAGSMFEGFVSYNLGPISFEDLNSKLDGADLSSVDGMVSDQVAGDSDSDYGLIKSKARILPFGKLIGNRGMSKAF